MCKGSVEAEHTRRGKLKDALGIVIGAFGLGQLHPIGITAEACTVCVHTGTKLRLSGIPEGIRDALGVEEDEDIVFIETEGSDEVHIHDLVQFANHPDLKPVPLITLAFPEVRVEVTYVPFVDISPLTLTLHDVRPRIVEDDDRPFSMALEAGLERRAA